MTPDADELKRAVEERLATVERDVAGLKDHVRESTPLRTYGVARQSAHVAGRIAASLRAAWTCSPVAMVFIAAAVGVVIGLRRR